MLQNIMIFLLVWFAISIGASLLFGRLASLNAHCDDDIISTTEETSSKEAA